MSIFSDEKKSLEIKNSLKLYIFTNMKNFQSKGKIENKTGTDYLKYSIKIHILFNKTLHVFRQKQTKDEISLKVTRTMH